MTAERARGVNRDGQGRGMSAASRMLMVLTLVVVVAGLFFQISRMAEISTRSRQIGALSTAIRDLTSEQQYLEIELATRQNLDRVKDEAFGRLGMVYPSEEQVRVVSIPSAYGTADSALAEGSGQVEWIELVGDGSGM